MCAKSVDLIQRHLNKNNLRVCSRVVVSKVGLAQLKFRDQRFRLDKDDDFNGAAESFTEVGKDNALFGLARFNLNILQR